MSQRGFTLLEMMLVLLLIGVSTSMVLLAFPSARTQEATQILARFQAQLDFVRERGQQTGQLFGIIIHPERWQFMRLQPADDSAPAAADDRWGNAQWLPLQAGRVTTAETLPRARLTLRFPDGQAWTPGEQPDVLIFPGGEVTPFQLRIDAAMGINVDAQGDSQPLAAREQP
ncbi:TPA: type II secretion system protein GspH [Klebsiella pneumoniae]|nr:type II secretion system protein GspH [Klebsiella pneumoniae]HBZ1197396.1 type II secretion system protein GspH [Klebsiella pneumoniae]